MPPRRAIEPSCAACHDAGWVRVWIGPENWRTEIERCPCQREAVARRAFDAARAVSDLSELQARLCTFDAYDGVVNGEALAAAQSWAEDPDGLPWLVLDGITGSGKSHLLVAAFNRLVERGRLPIYCVVPSLLDTMRDAVGAGDGRYSARFAAVKEAPILLLDDFGAEKGSDWVDETLFKLVDWRYNRAMPTVFATNLRVVTPPGRPADLEPRIASRLQDGALSRVVQMRGPDRRLKGKVSPR